MPKKGARKPVRRPTSFRGLVASRPFRAALVLVAVVLAATVDERLFGVISDEQQMLFTGVSMAEQGEIGIARGQLFMVHRPAGDAVSPYGMGNSLLLAVPSLVAERWERSFGAGSSQTLFVLVPLALILAGAWLAGLAARELGAGERGAAVAAVAASIASPLWAYGGTAYSEPLQAVLFAGAVVLSLRAARALGEGMEGRPLALSALGAGLLAGGAVLGKSVNLPLVPVLLLPLLAALARPGERRVRLRAAGLVVAGGMLPAAAWLAFEVVRFGRPFTSYGGQNFTHPFLDGFWRLLVGANEGLLVFFPALLLAVAGLVLLAREPEERWAAAALGGPLVFLLLVTSSWWAWDGVVGWGPRFLVPAIPLLAAAAGVAAARLRRGQLLAGLLLGLGVALNLVGVLVPDTAVSAWVSSAPGTKLTEEERLRFPDYFLERGKDGGWVLPRHFSAARDAAFSPMWVRLALLRIQLSGGGEIERKSLLARAPWLDAVPDAVPALEAAAFERNAALRVLVSPFRWPHLGRALAGPRGVDESFQRAWGFAIADQVLRNLDIGRPEKALGQAERLFAISPSGYTAALLAESLRASRRFETVNRFLASLPAGFRTSPSLGVVTALVARDTGDEATAARLLGEVSRVFRRPGVLAAAGRPPSEWPAGLHQMTGDNLATRELALPELGK